MSNGTSRVTLEGEEGNKVFQSNENMNDEPHDKHNERDDTIMEINCEKGEENQLEEKILTVEDIEEPFETVISEGDVLEGCRGIEQMKHVTCNDSVEVLQVNSSHNDIVFKTSDEACTGGVNLSDPNFKRRVTFSTEIIVIPFTDKDLDQTNEYSYDDQDTKEEKIEETFKGVFGVADKQEELTVNYAEAVSSKNIFKAVSFSNDVTVVDDGNVVFTTTMQESDLETSSRRNHQVDKLLNKLKQVVQKLEDSNKHSNAKRNNKVLGDAEQVRSSHQVEIIKLDGLERSLMFSNGAASEAEPREPDLRRVTFSKEIIVIACPRENVDDADSPYWREYEQSSMDYAPGVSNICKTVSFSNEVTVIHDRNLVFTESTESLKESEEVRKTGVETE